MEKEDIKKLCEERGITYKADFMDGLSEKQFDEGCIKLYIPADGNGGCGEGIWGWIARLRRKIKRSIWTIISMERLKLYFAIIQLTILESCFGVVKFRLFAREKTDQCFRKTTLKMCYFQL